MLIHLSAATITGSLTSAGPPAPTYDPAFYTDVAVRTDPFESAKSHFFDTSSWGAFCDVTLTLKQTRQSDSGGWVKIDDYRCRQAFRHFMSLLNRAVYGAAFRRHGKRLRVLPVLERGEVHARALRSWERGTSGRWHIHCAIELPSHCDAVALERLIRNCWAKVEWSSGRILVRDGANAGWINYMLKNRQKSDFDGFLDCIIIESEHNPIADAKTFLWIGLFVKLETGRLISSRLVFLQLPRAVRRPHAHRSKSRSPSRKCQSAHTPQPTLGHGFDRVVPRPTR